VIGYAAGKTLDEPFQEGRIAHKPDFDRIALVLQMEFCLFEIGVTQLALLTVFSLFQQQSVRQLDDDKRRHCASSFPPSPHVIHVGFQTLNKLRKQENLTVTQGAEKFVFKGGHDFPDPGND
jgi:hypothetical protein